MQENNPLVRFDSVDVKVGENVILYNVDMEVNPGDFVYIIGKVGTGKTSIIRTMIAESIPDKGSCTVCDYRIERIRTKEIPMLRRRIGVVFQDFQLLMDRDVHANLEFVLQATGWKDPIKIDNRIEEVLQAVGMITKEHRMPHQLSGGEQQRIAIARALLNSPSLIVADEPTGNLDPETSDGIMTLLQKINRENGSAIVIVTHARDLITRYPGRVFLCENETCTEISGNN